MAAILFALTLKLICGIISGSRSTNQSRTPQGGVQMQNKKQCVVTIYWWRRVVAFALFVLVAISFIATNRLRENSRNDAYEESYYEGRLYGLSEYGADLFARQAHLRVGSQNVVQFSRLNPELRSDKFWWERLPEPQRSAEEANWRSFAPKWARQEAEASH